MRLASGIRRYDASSWLPSSTDLSVKEMAGFRLSPDGRFLFAFVHPGGMAPSPSGHLEVLDTQTGKQVWRSTTLRGDLYQGSLVIADDGSWFAVVLTAEAEEDDHVELVELPTFKRLGRFGIPSKVTVLRRPWWRPRALPPTPSVHGVPLSVPNNPPDWSLDKVSLQPVVVNLAASPDSAWLAINWMGSANATSVIDVRKAALRETLPGSYFAFSPKGRYLMLDEASGARALYDTRTGKGALFYDPLCPPQGNLFKPSFSPDESLVALTSLQFNACLVETKTGRLRGLVPPQLPTASAFEDEGIIVPGAWLSDGSGLLMATMMSGLQLFELGSYSLKPLGTGPGSMSALADNSLSSPSVIRREMDQSLLLFSVSGYPAVEIVAGQTRNLGLPEGEFALFAASPDGERYVREEQTGAVIRSTRTGELVATLNQSKGSGLSFDPKGRWVFLSDSDQVSVWDAATGERRLSLSSCPPASRARAYGTP
ncbi:MAG: hypothetical protein H6718_19550 [Polyangiaceae bacterium]|nr:hypothetical protein [Polyangiaceae bacterium]